MDRLDPSLAQVRGHPIDVPFRHAERNVVLRGVAMHDGIDSEKPGMGCPSPEPGDNGRAHATSLVMRRPVRGPNEFLGRAGRTTCALCSAKPEPQ